MTTGSGPNEEEIVAVGPGAASSTEGVVPHEVELKYAVRDADALRAWLAADWGGALDGAAIRSEKVVEVEDRYLDTAYGALEKAGFGARLRREDGGAATITLKSTNGHDEAQGSALTDRIEVEGPAGDVADPASWPPSGARELIEELRDGARLRILFQLDQRREKRALEVDGAAIEVTLDHVAVVRGGRVLGRFDAMEVEADSADRAVLHRLAGLVEETGFVRAERRSKEELGRAEVARAAEVSLRPLPEVPKSPGIVAEDTLGGAGRKVLRMHLARMLRFEEGTRRGEDAEDLHKMRVATRRMRAAWRVFEDAYRPKLVRRYVRELRGVARALGAVRDMDVLLKDLETYLEPVSEAGREALEPLRESWSAEREVARGRLIDRLDSRRYRTFVDDHLAFTEAGGAGEETTRLGQPVLVRDTAGSRILIAYERLRAYETVLDWADVPTFHQVRIEAKRLRYALEYFSEVLPVTSRGLIRTVTQLQDELGAMNDAHVAATVTRAWLNEHGARLPASSRDAVGYYLERRERDIVRARRSYRPVWRRITGRTFRRSLGRSITSIE